MPTRLRQRIRAILDLTADGTRVSFVRLLNDAPTRIEVIVTFLAVLEMIKRRQIHARQEGLFGEIVLERRTDMPPVELSTEEIEADYTTE